MKPKSIFHTVFVLIACSTLVLVTTGCPFPTPTASTSTASTGTASTGSITGKVLAQGQTDNSGATVTAEPTDGIRSVSVQRTISSRQAVRAVAAAQATTDASGTYTLTGLTPGIYTLSAVSKDGLQKAVTTSVTVGAGSTTQALLMILTQTGQIRGVVTLADDSDPMGIVVFIAGTSYSAMTDASGNYLMSWVPAGKNYTLVASKAGYVSGIRNVDVTVNQTKTMDSIELATYVAPQNTGSVSGTVTLSGAATNDGIFVYLVGTPYIGVTNAEGKFSLTGVALGTYKIMACKEGYSAQLISVTVPQAAPISFILTPLGPYFVTYENGHGGTGNVPIDPTNYMPGFRVTVMGNTGDLVNPGCSFAGWNTQADGSGISYAPGQTFSMGSSNVTLFASWTTLPTYTVTYDGNGATGGNVPIDTTAYLSDQTVTVLGNSGSLVKAGYSFAGWTMQHGGGTTYSQGQTFTMGNSDVILYASWASGESEYFVSFKFDGTPVKFTEGILEWGNVPLAGVETGWVHNDHVYDRTHITALPVGLPMTEMSENTFIGFTLVGEPGSQPPPAGTYTFSDGFHEIYNLSYESPGSRCKLYDPSGNFGSATVVLTTVGGVGGFIEGTFSAKVLEQGTFAPHYITEGAFRVKLL